jgi:hypothetical protein
MSAQEVDPVGDAGLRVRGVLADIFNLDPAEIDGGSSKDTVHGWDSLQHLTVARSLEEEFKGDTRSHDLPADPGHGGRAPLSRRQNQEA